MYLIWSHSKFRRVDEPLGSREEWESTKFECMLQTSECAHCMATRLPLRAPISAQIKIYFPHKTLSAWINNVVSLKCYCSTPPPPKAAQNLIIHDVCELWQLFALSLLSLPRLHIFQGKIIIITLSLSHKKVVKLSTHRDGVRKAPKDSLKNISACMITWKMWATQFTILLSPLNISCFFLAQRTFTSFLKIHTTAGGKTFDKTENREREIILKINENSETSVWWRRDERL